MSLDVQIFFENHLECYSILLLFELSKRFKSLFTFPSSINQANTVAFLSEISFFALSVNSLFLDSFAVDK